MSNLQRVEWGTRLIWLGEFNHPLTMECFLISPKQQLQVFETDLSERYYRIANSSVESYLGKRVDSLTVTLSGLLALVYSAGIRGAKKWLASEDDRSKHPNTTLNFGKSNGIF